MPRAEIARQLVERQLGIHIALALVFKSREFEAVRQRLAQHIGKFHRCGFGGLFARGLQFGFGLVLFRAQPLGIRAEAAHFGKFFSACLCLEAGKCRFGALDCLAHSGQCRIGSRLGDACQLLAEHDGKHGGDTTGLVIRARLRLDRQLAGCIGKMDRLQEAIAQFGFLFGYGHSAAGDDIREHAEDAWPACGEITRLAEIEGTNEIVERGFRAQSGDRSLDIGTAGRLHLQARRRDITAIGKAENEKRNKRADQAESAYRRPEPALRRYRLLPCVVRHRSLFIKNVGMLNHENRPQCAALPVDSQRLHEHSLNFHGKQNVNAAVNDQSRQSGFKTPEASVGDDHKAGPQSGEALGGARLMFATLEIDDDEIEIAGILGRHVDLDEIVPWRMADKSRLQLARVIANKPDAPIALKEGQKRKGEAVRHKPGRRL